MRTRVKFCGLTNTADIQAAAALGVDAIGFVFYPPAAVAISMATATHLASHLPLWVSTVALFVNAPSDTVFEVINAVRPHYLQFHGDEDSDYCSQFGLAYIKACRVRNKDDINTVFQDHPQAAAVLLDAYHPQKQGGTGQVFDWSLIPPSPPLPLILAGGLDPTNVEAAISQVRPYGVDVSGGIADCDKRYKNKSKMEMFINHVQKADAR